MHLEWPLAVRSSEIPADIGDDVRGDLGLWEEIFSSSNLVAALKRVERNKGGPGVDGLSTDDLRDWLGQHWEVTRKALDEGTYAPLANAGRDPAGVAVIAVVIEDHVG